MGIRQAQFGNGAGDEKHRNHDCVWIGRHISAHGERACQDAVYTDSSQPGWNAFANAVNASNAEGAPDGTAAFVPVGGFIAFLVDPTFTTVDLNMEFLGITGAGTVRLYVGLTNGSGGFTALNSTFFTVTPGNFNFTSTALSTYCTGLGGCDTYVVQAWTGTTFTLDSVLAPNPEPSVWALMILSFAGVAARMKSLRKHGTASVTGRAFAAPQCA